MGNGVHAIVIFYDGKTPVDTDIALISNVIDERLGMVGDGQVLVYSAEELAGLVLTGSQSPVVITKQPRVVESKLTPEDNAVIYIGELFKDELSNSNDSNFIASLFIAIENAKRVGGEDSKKLLNAGFILSKEDLCISKKLLKKYNLDERRISTIKRVFQLSQYE